MNFTKTKLDNGMTLLMERVENVHSISLGVWVRTGSRDENPSLAGISHFLEHMLFKGTVNRSAHDIAVEMDSLGGEMNAFTSKEGTTFYIKVLDEYLSTGIDLLSEIFLHSTYPEQEIEREKGVIIEEIRMTCDTPDDYIHDIFSHEAWGGQSVGRPVLGSEDTVSSITRDNILGYVDSRYGTNNTLISCAGNFDEADLKDRLNKAFSGFTSKAQDDVFERPIFVPAKKVITKDLSEAHICIGFEGIAQSSEDRYAALLLSTILGGGMSSRLFQEIREKRGLAYSVYSFLSSYMDTGMWGIYAGTAPEKAAEVIDLSLKELNSLPDDISSDELSRARTQLMSNVMFGLESTSRRMQNIASQEIYYGEYFSPEEVIAKINNITINDLRQLCHRLIDNKQPAIVALGQVDDSILKSH